MSAVSNAAPEALPVLARLFQENLRAGEYEAALDAARKIAAAAPTRRRSPLRLAGILARLDRHDEAAQVLAEAAPAFPEDVEMALLQARVLARLGQHRDAAVALTRASTLAPADARIASQLAGSLTLAEEFEAAVLAYQGLLELEPGNPTAQAALAKLLAQLGRKEAASEAATAAVALDPKLNNRKLAKIIRANALGAPAKKGPKTALNGSDGFMFHEIDSAFAQMCGDPADPADVAAFAAVIRQSAAWCEARGMVYRLLIVPERHVLYADKLPAGYTSQPERMAVRLMRELAADPGPPRAVYPFAEMLAGRNEREVCKRQDVHWTNYGAYLAYAALLRTIPDLQPEILKLEEFTVRTAHRVGDMAIWHGLRTREEQEMMIGPAGDLHEVFSTKTFTNGQVDVYRTDCPSPRRLVLLRTSNSTSLLPLFAHHYSRIVAVAGGDLYYELLKSEQPHTVIVEMPERYLGRKAGRGASQRLRLPRNVGPGGFTRATKCTLPLPGA